MMPNSFSMIVTLISAITSVSAAIFSYKNYARSRTMDNENQLYKNKLEVYPKLYMAAFTLKLKHKTAISRALNLLKDGGDMFADGISGISAEAQKSRIEFGESVLPYFVFIPDNLLAKINEFLDSPLFTVDFFKLSSNTVPDETEADTGLGQILSLMRRDIGLEKLNIKLGVRIDEYSGVQET